MKTILIIDDEPILNNAYCALLKDSGYNTLGALSAAEGIELLKSQNPDAILLDLNMPELDGIGFLKAINISKNYPNTKVIIFTVSSEDKRIDKAFELGASKYILKALLSPNDLVTIVKKEIEN